MMRHCRAAVFALVVSACPVFAGADEDVERAPVASPVVKLQRAEVRTLTVAGVERSYRLYRPIFLKPRRPAPLVVVLHGARGHSEQIERNFGFNAVADREDLVIAYPQGLGSVWNDGREPELRKANKSASADDVGFLLALVDHLIATGVADRTRVHLAGVSNGGFMAARMACEASDTFAAFAVLIASVPSSYRGTCKPTRPLPVLVLNGAQDRVMPWEGFVPPGHPRDGPLGIMAVPDHIAFWVERNGCVTSSSLKLNDTEPSDSSSILRSDWTGCKAGGAVTAYKIEGGGHQTPSPRVGPLDQVVGALLGPRNRDVEAAELVWEFFKPFKRGS